MLTITVQSPGPTRRRQPLSATFDEAGGRSAAPECTLVLADPDRKISRTHATVFHRDGAFGLRDRERRSGDAQRHADRQWPRMSARGRRRL
jgi:predicted component of type VI protein secretion system